MLFKGSPQQGDLGLKLTQTGGAGSGTGLSASSVHPERPGLGPASRQLRTASRGAEERGNPQHQDDGGKGHRDGWTQKHGNRAKPGRERGAAGGQEQNHHFRHELKLSA